MSTMLGVLALTSCPKCGGVLSTSKGKAPGGDIERTYQACESCPFFTVDPPFPPKKEEEAKS